MGLDDIQRDQKGAIMERVLRDYHRKEAYTIVKELLSQHVWKTLLEELNDTNDQYLKSVFNYLIAADKTASITEQNLLELVKRQLPDKEDTVMNLAEQWQQQGMQKGKQEGIHEGMQKGMRQTAYRMLQDGMLDETVKRYTGLTDEDIKQLKHNLNS